MVSFDNHLVTVYRNRRVGSTNRFTLSATFTPYNADIQPATLERQQLFPDRFGAVFSAFVDSTADVREGDYVHDESGKVYSVRGVSKWDGNGVFGDIDHLELTLIAQDAI